MIRNDSESTSLNTSDKNDSSRADIELAVKFLNLSYEKGVPQALFETSQAALNGEGLGDNDELGLLLLKAAAELNCPQALVYLGNCYLDGNLVGKNSRSAAVCLRKAALALEEKGL